MEIFMGMDVYGNNPSAPEGQYFRRSVWGWHPLADLVCDLAPEESGACTMWHTNDGDGLDACRANTLGVRLQVLLDDGTVAKYIAERDDRIAALPSQICTYCNGTGVRTDARAIEMGTHLRVIGTDTNEDESHPRFGETGWCNSCNGVGQVRSSQTHYSVDADDVSEFAAFLRVCGGFEIC